MLIIRNQFGSSHFGSRVGLPTLPRVSTVVVNLADCISGLQSSEHLLCRGRHTSASVAHGNHCVVTALLQKRRKKATAGANLPGGTSVALRVLLVCWTTGRGTGWLFICHADMEVAPMCHSTVMAMQCRISSSEFAKLEERTGRAPSLPPNPKQESESALDRRPLPQGTFDT